MFNAIIPKEVMAFRISSISFPLLSCFKSIKHVNRVCCQFRLTVSCIFVIMQPFWHVVNYSDSRGRGVVGEKPLDHFPFSINFVFKQFLVLVFFVCFCFIPTFLWTQIVVFTSICKCWVEFKRFLENLFWLGVLEANFIEPTHNKQDFEKTSVFQKLEYRLKEMTWEYW